MNYFALVFIGLLLTYGCLCDQTAKENLVNNIINKNDNSTAVQNDHQTNTTTTSTKFIINTGRQSLLSNQTVSLNNLLDRIYQNTDLNANSTQFKEMNVIDSKSDMQTAAGHKHKVVEHHHVIFSN